jgi:hypothetical protein
MMFGETVAGAFESFGAFVSILIADTYSVVVNFEPGWGVLPCGI